MDFKDIKKDFEHIEDELEDISEISRIIYETAMYNADNGADCMHIVLISEIQRKKISRLLEKCDILDSNILEYSLANN